MIRNILATLLFVAIASGMVQLVLVLFYKTLDGGIVAGGSIVLGLGLACLIYYFVFDASDISYTLVSLGIGLLISSFSVKWIDRSNAPQENIPLEFQIVAIGSSSVKSTEFVYLQLHSPQGNAKYTIDKKQLSQFSVGDSLHLNTTVGYFGFPTVQSNGLITE